MMKVAGKDENRVYLGTKVNAGMLASPFNGECKKNDQGQLAACIFYPFILIDFPLSLITDTVFLPYTVSTKPEHESETHF